MREQSIQVRLFDQIKTRHTNKSEFIESIRQLLSCSADTAYRRSRGDSTLTPDEMVILSKHYKISLDQLIFEGTPPVMFSFNAFDRTIKDYEDYFDSILAPLERLRQIPDVKIHYASLEIPIFYYCFFPELINFKLYVWGRSVWDLPHTQHAPFSFDLIAPSGVAKAQHMLDIYTELPSLQMWSLNIFDNTLNQIEYHAIGRRFKNPDDAFRLLECLDLLLDHMKVMAQNGHKKPLKGYINRAPLELYHNEMIYTNNTIMVLSPHYQGIFTSYGNPNFLFSADPRMVTYTKEWFARVLDKAHPLSQSSEKNRDWFFSQISTKVAHTRKRLEVMR
jgi:hypothetical protein